MDLQDKKSPGCIFRPWEKAQQLSVETSTKPLIQTSPTGHTNSYFPDVKPIVEKHQIGFRPVPSKINNYTYGSLNDLKERPMEQPNLLQVNQTHNVGSFYPSPVASTLQSTNLTHLLQVEQYHLELLKEFQNVPESVTRNSPAASLWISTLLQSYVVHMNAMVTSTEKMQLIDGTRKSLREFLGRGSPSVSTERSPTSSSMLSSSAASTSFSDHGYLSQGSSSDDSACNTPSPPGSLQCSPVQVKTEPGIKSPANVYGGMQTTNYPDLVKSARVSYQHSNTLLAVQSPSGINITGSIPSNVPQSITTPQIQNSPHQIPKPNHVTKMQEALAAQYAFHTANSSKYFAPTSRYVLEEWYQSNLSAPYASDIEADDLAKRAGMTRAQVLKWLSNRRNRDGNTKHKVGRRPKSQYKPYTRK